MALLRRTIGPGIAVEAPFSWEELSALVAANRLDVLGRESAMQQKYEAWLAETRSTWRSVADLCKTKYLGFHEAVDPLTGLYCAVAVPDHHQQQQQQQPREPLPAVVQARESTLDKIIDRLIYAILFLIALLILRRLL